MLTTTLYFVPLANLFVREGEDAAGLPTGPLFPGDKLQGDRGNPAAVAGEGGQAARVTLTGEAQSLRIRDDDRWLNDDRGFNQDTNFPLPQANQTVVGGSAGVLRDSLVQVQYAYVLKGGDGARVTVHAVSIRPPGALELDDNTIAGIVTSAPLTPGISYRVIEVRELSAPAYESLATCFTAGTMIAAEAGTVAVEALRPGMLVLTRDRGLQAVRWHGVQHLGSAALRARPGLRPVRIRAGALGDGTPTTDLVVSPQHRILVRSPIALRMFGTIEVLVAARQLLCLDGIEVAEDLDSVTYVHFAFDRHEVVVSNGAATESLYPGPEALKAVGPAGRAELLAIFPQLVEGDPARMPPAARMLAGGRQARSLALRHHQNARPLVG